MTLRTRVVRWPVTAFVTHTLFVLLVPVVERYSHGTLRNLLEYALDRPAFELWWWLQNSYPRQLADLTFPLAQQLGLQLLSDLIWLTWYVIVGSVPYVLVTAVLGRIRDIRTLETSRHPT